MNRTEEIRDRLAKHWAYVGVAVSPIPPEHWEGLQLGPMTQFGVGSPQPFHLEPLVVPFQPELINEITQSLTPDDFSDYLDAIESIVDVAIRLVLEEGLDPDEAIIAGEIELIDDGFTGSVALLSDTQAAFLDRVS